MYHTPDGLIHKHGYESQGDLNEGVENTPVNDVGEKADEDENSEAAAADERKK